MIQIRKVANDHTDFTNLVQELNAFLAITDGDEHAFYDQYNQLDDIQHIVVAYNEEAAVACGAIKAYDADTYEVKRMYTQPAARGKGIAKQILAALETWAKDLGATSCVLETGIRQTAAVALYHAAGYSIIENYGQYQGVENSLCFRKTLA